MYKKRYIESEEIHLKLLQNKELKVNNDNERFYLKTQKVISRPVKKKYALKLAQPLQDLHNCTEEKTAKADGWLLAQS